MESIQRVCWVRVVLIDKTKQNPLMTCPRTRSAAGSGRSRDGLAATARRPRLAHSLHPLLFGSATFAEDTASCLRLPILTAWQHEPLATSVRTSGRDPRVQPLRSHVPGSSHVLPLCCFGLLGFRPSVWSDLVLFGLVCYECLVANSDYQVISQEY